MSNVDVKNDFQEWITTIGYDLPDIAALHELIKECKNEDIHIHFCDPEKVDQFMEWFEQQHIETDSSNNILQLFASDRRYMMVEPELKPLRQDPFWTQQGKRTKGKRGRYS